MFHVGYWSMPPAVLNTRHPPPVMLDPRAAAVAPRRRVEFPRAFTYEPAVPHDVRGDSVRYGCGTLSWLSSKAGLLDTDLGQLSFDARIFADPRVENLAHALHPGMLLKFKAARLRQTGSWVTLFVLPLAAADMYIYSDIKADMASFIARTPGNEAWRDGFDPDFEVPAMEAVLEAFAQLGSPRVQIGLLHRALAALPDDDMKNYLGVSNHKRLEWFVRRRHLLQINNGDLTIELKPVAEFEAMTAIAREIVRRGGICLLHDAHAYAQSLSAFACLPALGRPDAFLALLREHNWLFCVLPSETFVSCRRQLPDIDYGGFIEQTFPTVQQLPLTPSPTRRDLPRQDPPRSWTRRGQDLPIVATDPAVKAFLSPPATTETSIADALRAYRASLVDASTQTVDVEYTYDRDGDSMSPPWSPLIGSPVELSSCVSAESMTLVAALSALTIPLPPTDTELVN